MILKITVLKIKLFISKKRIEKCSVFTELLFLCGNPKLRKIRSYFKLTTWATKCWQRKHQCCQVSNALFDQFSHQKKATINVIWVKRGCVYIWYLVLHAAIIIIRQVISTTFVIFFTESLAICQTNIFVRNNFFNSTQVLILTFKRKRLEEYVFEKGRKCAWDRQTFLNHFQEYLSFTNSLLFFYFSRSFLLFSFLAFFVRPFAKLPLISSLQHY